MQFTYKIVNKEGKEVTGSIEAPNRTGAITTLQSKGNTVLSLEEKRTKSLNVNIFQRVKRQDIVIFSRQIATMFEAEISALRSFNLVAEATQSRYFQEILGDIAKRIEQGLSIEKAFMKHQKIFGEFFVSIISIGEQSGTMSRSFSYLAEHMERSAELASKLRKALSYPIFVILTFIGVMVLVMVTVIPQMTGILTGSGTELPAITKIVIAMSEFLKTNLILIVVSIIVIVVSTIFYARTEDGKKTFDSLFLEMPLIGKLLHEFYLVRFASNMSVMLASGVPVVTSLQILSRVMVNTVYKEIVLEISRQVQQGATLSSALKTHGDHISPNVISIIKIGEEAGELKKMVDVISNFYRQRLQDTIDMMIDLIQPAVIVLLGLGVGTLIGAVILPIYSISGSI